MGININRIKSNGNYIKIDSEIFDLLYSDFVIDTTVITIDKEELEKMIKKEKDITKKAILNKILKEFNDDDSADFIMG